MPRSIKIGQAIFCLILLLFVYTVRSGVLVDRSFIPRFTLLSLLLLVTWVICIGKKVRIRNDLFESAFILFYAWSLISILWSIECSETLLQSQLVFLTLALFLCASALTGKYPEFEGLFIRTHIIVLLFSYGLAFLKMSMLTYYDPYKIISISANNNLYSGFLLISLPLVFSGFILLRGAWKYLSVATAILAFFFIIIIQSRAVYMGTLFSLAIVFGILPFRYKVCFTRRNLLTGLIALILLVAMVVIFLLTLDLTRKEYFLQKIMVWEYFRSYDDLQASNIRKMTPGVRVDHTKMAAFDYSEEYYANANLRLIFWKKSLGLMAERPLSGAGAGSWRLAIPSIKDPPNPEHTMGNCTYSEPHNEWIRIMSELGIIGFGLAFLIFFFPPAYVICRILTGPGKCPPESLFYASFVFGFYLFAAFDFPFRRVEHNVTLWLIFAFMLNKVPLPLMRYGFSRKHTRWQTLIFAGLLIFSMTIGVFRFRGEYFTVLMFRNERKDDKNVITFCQKAENPFYHITPNTLPVSWFEGVAHYRLGRYPSALNCFQRALKMTPFEVRVLNDYSAVLFKLGHPEEAIKVLKETLSIDPFFDDARFNLGAIYYYLGEPYSAMEQIKLCRESQKKHDYLEEMK